MHTCRDIVLSVEIDTIQALTVLPSHHSDASNDAMGVTTTVHTSYSSQKEHNNVLKYTI